MTHSEEQHERTRKEIHFGFANQLVAFSLTAKELQRVRDNQLVVNGIVEVPEEFGEADKGNPVFIPVSYDLELAD